MRKKAEHNEGEISTLEELSLHQHDIERYIGLNLKFIFVSPYPTLSKGKD